MSAQLSFADAGLGGGVSVAAGDDAPEEAPFWAHLHVPKARTFGDLFTAHTFGRKPGTERRRAPVRWDHAGRSGSHYLEQYCHIESRGEDPWVWGMDVQPTEAAAAVIREMFGLVDDPDIYFAILVREDGSALVLAKYSRIIGSRWLAEIDPATIPRPAASVAEKAAAAPSAGNPGREERIAELLGQMEVRGDVARFTGSKIDDWDLLKGAMAALGGAWVGGRTQGFRFGKRVDVARVIADAIATGKRSTPERDAEFFASPRAVADRVVALAAIEDGERVLEPSAGQGALADVVREVSPSAELVLCELLEDNRDVLIEKGYGAALVEERDFMRADLGTFDAVVMNPPFAHEVAHVIRAFGMLRPGGRLVSVMSSGVRERKDAATKAFRALVEERGFIEDLPEQSFRASGTSVRTVLVVLDRPMEVCQAEARDLGMGLALRCALSAHGPDEDHVADGMRWRDGQPPLGFMGLGRRPC